MQYIILGKVYGKSKKLKPEIVEPEQEITVPDYYCLDTEPESTACLGSN